MIIIERIPQAVVDEAIDKLTIAQLRAGTAVGQHVRSAAHILLPAGDNHVRFAALNRLRGQVQRLEPGTAYIVNGNGRNGIGQPAADCRLARRILAGARRQYLAEDHFIYTLGIDAAALN